MHGKWRTAAKRPAAQPGKSSKAGGYATRKGRGGKHSETDWPQNATRHPKNGETAITLDPFHPRDELEAKPETNSGGEGSKVMRTLVFLSSGVWEAVSALLALKILRSRFSTVLANALRKMLP